MGASDREQITDLLFTYADRIDAGDFDGVADLFADADVTFEGFDQVRHGRDEVRAMYEASTRRYDDGTPRTKHVMTNVVVTVDEPAGTATARSYFTVLQAVPDRLALQPIVAGRYRDRFDRAEGTWRFRHRHMVVDLVGDVGHHTLFDLR
ncbi:MAG TPA: nuclear transport factor 2 family protein [Acidimicrobiales bacterium]|nr:nuclear transport factor 2 family protein [Acidimicrobiales bacterium]